MSFLLEDFQPYNFSVNFGENVLFSTSHYEGNPPDGTAMYFFPLTENYNAPFTMHPAIKNTYDFFAYCNNFNSPVYIDPNHPNLLNMDYTFYTCPNFNQDFNIPVHVYNARYVLYGCENYQSNIYIYTNTLNWTRNPDDWERAQGDFYCGFSGCSGNFNAHFINVAPLNLAYTFEYCYYLNQNIQIPSSVNNIMDGFRGCWSLNQNIRLPDNVVADYCFSECESFNRNIRIPRNSYIRYLFRNCNSFNQPVYVPVFQDAYAIFDNCLNLNANVTFENGITTLQSTFHGCRNFNYPVTIPPSVNALLETFYGCYNFNVQPILYDNITQMYLTFAGCHNLDIPITLPSSVEQLQNTFSDCRNLNQNIQIPSSVTEMTSTFAYCRNLDQNILIPSNVTITSHCFENCTALNQNIYIPTSVDTTSYMFANCNHLDQSIHIPESVVVAVGMFEGCQNFNQSMYIPNSVTNADRIFNWCLDFNPPEVIFGTNCRDVVDVLRGTSARNVTFLSDAINIRKYSSNGITKVHSVLSYATRREGGGYQNIGFPLNSEGLTPATFDGRNYDGGDAFLRINIKKNCDLYYNQWNSTQQEYVNHHWNVNDVFYSSALNVYYFLGLSDGYIYKSGRSYYRTPLQPNNYTDYTNNFNNGMGGIQAYKSNENCIIYHYIDYANTYTDPTWGRQSPHYPIYINFI